jgi:hypothetical protein
MSSMSASSTVQHHPLLRYIKLRQQKSLAPVERDPPSPTNTFLSKSPSSYHDIPPIQHTSFDFPPTSLGWCVHSPPNKGSIRKWLERKYYQYEVTWGPYVLTPGEKIFVNSMVVVMFCLILYGFFKLSIVHKAAGIIIRYIGILVKEGLRTLTSLKDLVMDAAFPGSLYGERANWITNPKAVVDHITTITATSHPVETSR